MSPPILPGSPMAVSSALAAHIASPSPPAPLTSPRPPSIPRRIPVASPASLILDHQRATTTVTETTRRRWDGLDLAQTRAHQPGSGAPTLWLSRCMFFWARIESTMTSRVASASSRSSAMSNLTRPVPSVLPRCPAQSSHAALVLQLSLPSHSLSVASPVLPLPSPCS